MVLEGGAMRGLFTAGVIDVMMENGIDYDAVCGVSAGAAFGCNYKSRQIGRVIRYNTLLAHNWRYCGLRSLLLTGDLYGAEFCYHTLPEMLDIMDKKTYDENPQVFYCVCTDAETGKPVYKNCDTLNYKTLEYMRASASMPVASTPVEIDGKKLLDGGISDSIPVKFMKEEGYTRQVVVLTQPEGYAKKPQKAMPLLRRALREYPAVADDLSTRHVVYNHELEQVRELVRTGEAYAIYPPEDLEIGKTEHDTAKMWEVYRIGRETAAGQIADIKAFLSNE